jgi:hypothetical protein
MSFLKYYQGANPGKKRKNATPSEEEKKLQQQKYEERRPDRKFLDKWLVGRPWLLYDNDIPDKSYVNNEFKKNMNTFIAGCKNFRFSTIADHESSRIHIKASEFVKSKNMPDNEIMNSEAGKAVSQLKAAETSRLSILFRNAHSVCKNNRPLTDFIWLCQLDKVKGFDIGETYMNEKAATNFIKYIGISEREQTISLLEKSPVFSFSISNQGPGWLNELGRWI